MDALLLSARCVLAVVFGVAAIAKLLDLDGSQRALEEFGLPSRLSRPGGLALPVAELAVAISLLMQPSARWGAAAAFLLLLAFTGALARAMARGRTPDCHCFGQLHSEPAGRATVIRNAVLAALAAVIVVGGSGPSFNRGLASLHGAAIALVAVSALAALQAVAIAELWADRRRWRREPAGSTPARTAAPGLRRNTRAPDFDLVPVRGVARSLEALLRSAPLTALPRPVVLMFLSTSCQSCVELLPSLARWQESLSESVTLAAIFGGERKTVERLCDEHHLSLALVQTQDEAFELYRLRATPSAVLVGSDGTVASAPAEGAPAIEALIRATVTEPVHLVAANA